MKRAITPVVVVLLAVQLIGMWQVPGHEVVLTLTAVDEAGKPLGTLRAGDVVVAEEGVQQTVKSLEPIGNVPATVALLLDASNSMKGEFATAQAIANDCVKRLRPRDTASLIGFNDRREKLQDFTDDRARLERAITRVKQRGATALYVALFQTLREFERRAARVGARERRVIVVLSDGNDTASLVPFQDVRDLARRSDTTVYQIVVSSRVATRDARDEADLMKLAEETGGFRLVPGASSPMTEVCGRIFDDLSNQYELRYVSSPPGKDGTWRRVEVRVNGPNVRVRTRAGYVRAAALPSPDKQARQVEMQVQTRAPHPRWR